MNKAKNQRYLNTFVLHTGSRAPDEKYGEHAKAVVNGASQAGYTKMVYGDGRVGTMGIGAKKAIKLEMEVQGITLDFFNAAQGASLPGAKPSISVHTMTERKAAMRNMGDVVVALSGGFGTLEEVFEWWGSENGKIKPSILSPVGGYYDGLVQFVDDAVERGHVLPSIKERFHVARDADEAAELMSSLAFKPQIKDHGAPIPANFEMTNHITRNETSIVVDHASLDIMEQISATMVGYDLANVEGQTIWEPHSVEVDGIQQQCLRKIIFDNRSGVFDGFKKQVDTIIEIGFTPSDRAPLVQFATAKSELGDMVQEAIMNPFLVSHLKSKHAEAKKSGLANDNSTPAP